MLLALRSLWEAITVSLVGVTAAAAIGTSRIDVSIPTTGVSASPSIGTVGFIDDFTVTGVSATPAIGTVTFSGTGGGINYGFGEGFRRPKTINRQRIRERSLSRERVLLRELEKITEPPPIIVVSARGVHGYPYTGKTNFSIDFSVVRGSPHVSLELDSVSALASVKNVDTSTGIELSDEEILAILEAA